MKRLLPFLEEYLSEGDHRECDEEEREEGEGERMLIFLRFSFGKSANKRLLNLERFFNSGLFFVMELT